MLRLEGVDAAYGRMTVLRNVSLAVPPGSLVALLGPNGAGKSTLLSVASGLMRPRLGAVTLDGVDLTGRRPHQFVEAGVCLIPEGRGVFPELTVRENLELQALDESADDAVARAAEAFPRLGERLNQTVRTMSGGEQQMLALTRSYVQRPRYVLLDEVSMGLSPRLVDEVFEFLARLRENGSSILLVEQYVSRALEVADYVYILNKGSMQFVGEPSEVAGDALFESYLGAGAAS